MLNDVIWYLRIVNDYPSIKEVAEKMGVTSAYLCEIEKGKKKPSLNILQKIASEYNVPLSQILFFDEKIERDKLNYQEALYLIVEYYINKKDPSVNTQPKILKK